MLFIIYLSFCSDTPFSFINIVFCSFIHFSSSYFFFHFFFFFCGACFLWVSDIIRLCWCKFILLECCVNTAICGCWLALYISLLGEQWENFSFPKKKRVDCMISKIEISNWPIKSIFCAAKSIAAWILV